MISVSICINGHPIYTRTAVNVGYGATAKGTHHIYTLDDGKELRHDPEDVAIPLAIIKMLKTIVEVKK